MAYVPPSFNVKTFREIMKEKKREKGIDNKKKEILIHAMDKKKEKVRAEWDRSNPEGVAITPESASIVTTLVEKKEKENQFFVTREGKRIVLSPHPDSDLTGMLDNEEVIRIIVVDFSGYPIELLLPLHHVYLECDIQLSSDGTIERMREMIQTLEKENDDHDMAMQRWAMIEKLEREKRWAMISEMTDLKIQKLERDQLDRMRK